MARLRTWQLVPLAALAATAGLPATAAPAVASPTTYTITDMGTLGLGVGGTAINANGQVTGGASLSTTYKIPCPPHHPNPNGCFTHPGHAFLYSNGQMTDLGTLGGHNSQGKAINLSGQVAGWAQTTSGQDAALWTGSKTINLGALAPITGSSVAYGINDAGQVVGTWDSNFTSVAFLYSNGTNTDLPDPSFTGGLGCQAQAINNKTEIAGVCWDTSNFAHLVRWENGSVTDLTTLNPGVTAIVAALSINNNGQIAGWFYSATGNPGFLYSNGTLSLLGSFQPKAINDNGVMVGGQDIDNGGTLQNLNNLIPAQSGYSIVAANAINDSGQIVASASGTPSGGGSVVLTPG